MSVRNFDVGKTIENLNGSPQYLGTISVTTSVTSSNLSGSIKVGDRLILQPDAACFVLADTDSSGTITSSTGLKLAADEKFYLCLKDHQASFNQNGEGYIQAITASGTANLKVYRLD